MGIEIERKFLVDVKLIDNVLDRSDYYEVITQAQLGSSTKQSSTRVRIVDCHTAWLTIKGDISGISRHEFEYKIPVSDANMMINEMCDRPPISKVRHYIKYYKPNADNLPDGIPLFHTWEIDVFGDANSGLIVAEIELQSEVEAFLSPSWLGEEVTMDPRYINSNLYKLPFTKW